MSAIKHTWWPPSSAINILSDWQSKWIWSTFFFISKVWCLLLTWLAKLVFLKIYINFKKLESGFNTLKIFHKNKQKSFLQILSSMPAVNTRSMCRSSFHQIHKVYLLISFPSSGKVPAINTYYHFNSHWKVNVVFLQVQSSVLAINIWMHEWNFIHGAWKLPRNALRVHSAISWLL